MNLTRLLRNKAGITQQDLAVAAGTSQSTIAAYESGAKSPTLRTMNKLADSLGMMIVADYVPKLTREDQRSLAFHREIAKILRKTPAPVIGRARRSLEKLSRIQPGADELISRWELWLQLPVNELITNLLDPGPVAREMRQVSPFSGILEPGTRARILRQFKAEYEQ